MFVVALTGGVAAGKSTVAEHFAKLGIVIIDTDELAKALVQPGTAMMDDVAEHFGDEFKKPDGSLNRPKVREHIFSHPEERTWLENLMHPYIRRNMKKEAEQAGSPYVIAQIPLLLETQPNDILDHVLVVDVPEKEQIRRVQKRDDISAKLAKQMLEAQASREDRLAIANDVIVNDGRPEDLSIRVLELHKKYLKMAEDYA